MNSYIFHFVFAFLAAASFALLFQTPKKIVWLCGIVGGIGWFVYEYMTALGYISFLANFAGSFVLTVIAGLFAGTVQKPLPAFVASGVIPLVPGLKLYDGMSALVLNNYDQGTKILLAAATDSIALALGIMLGTSIFHAMIRWKLGKLLQGEK